MREKHGNSFCFVFNYKTTDGGETSSSSGGGEEGGGGGVEGGCFK